MARCTWSWWHACVFEYALFEQTTDCSLAVLYDLTKRTARMLDLPLRLDAQSAPGPADAPKAYLRDGAAPELALVGATIVTLQLVYGLDGQNRCVKATRTYPCPVYGTLSSSQHPPSHAIMTRVAALVRPPPCSLLSTFEFEFSSADMSGQDRKRGRSRRGPAAQGRLVESDASCV